MIKLKNIFFESIYDHLKSRGVDLKRTHIITDSEDNVAYFFLYNLSGKLIGYQKYDPSKPKGQYGEDARYYSYISKIQDSEIAVYGLETYKINSEILFIVEGIFDCIKIHNAGYPAIATLGNSPSKKMISWLNTLPQIKIGIADNDPAGNKIKPATDKFFKTPDPFKDLGDMKQEQVNEFLSNIISKIK